MSLLSRGIDSALIFLETRRLLERVENLRLRVTNKPNIAVKVGVRIGTKSYQEQ